jgi:hypothetical protein
MYNQPPNKFQEVVVYVANAHPRCEVFFLVYFPAGCRVTLHPAGLQGEFQNKNGHFFCPTNFRYK